MGKPFWSPCPEPATWCQMKDEEPVLCCLRDARLPASSKSIVLYLCHFLKWWVFSAKKRPCDRRSSLAQTFASISGQDGGSRGFQTQVLLEVFPRFCRKAAGPVGLRGAYRGGHTAVFLGPRRRETGGGRKCKSVLKRSLFNKPHLWSVREVRIRCGSPSSGLPSPLPASFHARPYAHALLLSAPHPPPPFFFSPAPLLVPGSRGAACHRPSSCASGLCPQAWLQETRVCQNLCLCPSCRFSVSFQHVPLTFTLCFLS